MKLAILGSSLGVISDENINLSKKIGEYLAENKIVVVTGGSHGIPGLIAKAAFEADGETEAYSPDENEEKHKVRSDNISLKYFKKHKFVPGFTARSLEMLKNVDGAIVVNGRIGTLSEFTIALEEGLNIAVITGTGGIADHLEYIISIAKKEFPNMVIFNNDYKFAINKLIEIIKNK